MVENSHLKPRLRTMVAEIGLIGIAVYQHQKHILRIVIESIRVRLSDLLPLVKNLHPDSIFPSFFGMLLSCRIDHAYNQL